MTARVCANCGNPLPTSLDEFGDRDAPVCQACFLKGVTTVPSVLEEAVRDLEAKLANVQADLTAQVADYESAQEAINQCKDKDGIPALYINRRDQEWSEFRRLVTRRDEIKDQIYWAQERVRSFGENEKKRLAEWTQSVKGAVNA